MSKGRHGDASAMDTMKLSVDISQIIASHPQQDGVNEREGGGADADAFIRGSKLPQTSAVGSLAHHHREDRKLGSGAIIQRCALTP